MHKKLSNFEYLKALNDKTYIFKNFGKIAVLVNFIIQELKFCKFPSFFCRERKSERIERKFKSQNPDLRRLSNLPIKSGWIFLKWALRFDIGACVLVFSTFLTLTQFAHENSMSIIPLSFAFEDSNRKNSSMCLYLVAKSSEFTFGKEAMSLLGVSSFSSKVDSCNRNKSWNIHSEQSIS